jgi:threonyl-tRNA synthetase
VYLREDQIADEVKFLMDFILGYYDTFGLTAKLKFATRPEQRIGSDALWDRAEDALRAALDSTGRPYEMKEGDGAFYGPKIDFDVMDSIGRAWQLGTIQLDYNAPERFDLTYTGEDNAPHRPVVIHRAVSGSFERFIAILIEHFAGVFPVWLSPEQVRVIPIASDYNAHADALVARMKAAGIRATLDARNETLNYRVREGEVNKVPYMCVIGRREAEEDTVALRSRGAGKKQDIMSSDAFVARVLREIADRTLAIPAEVLASAADAAVQPAEAVT